MATKLEKQIMRRIYVLWLAKRVGNPLMLKIYGLAILTIALERLVSLRHVLENWPALGNVGGEANFVTYAFTHTQLATQIVTLGIAVIAALFVRDLFRHEDVSQFSYQLPLRPLR